MKTRLWICAAVALAACEGSQSLLDGSTPIDGGGDARPTLCDAPGALEQVPCGSCGTVRRFCTSEREWEYGECMGESGACMPGERRQASCGNCGMRTEVCSAGCTWEPLGACLAEGECAPGELVRTRDGCDRGQREARCSEACVFEPAGECEVDECTTPGATENVPCGNCGTRSRFCTSSGEWEYGPCEQQGACTPGTQEIIACGRCGERRARCTTACTWSDDGACTDEGECTPGESGPRTSSGCPPGSTRPTSCTNECTLEPTGSCSDTSAPGVGERCAAGNRCATGLICNDGLGGPFCRRPCTGDNDCPNSTACLDTRVCSESCTLFTDAGCPVGAKCQLIGARNGGGFPPLLGTALVMCSAIGRGTQGSTCRTHADCARDFMCVNRGERGAACFQVCDLAHACPSPLACSGVGGGLPPPYSPAGFCE